MNIRNVAGNSAILSDRMIIEINKAPPYDMQRPDEPNMIHPFSPTLVKHDEKGNPIVSYGLSSYGYDPRLSEDFKVVRQISIDGTISDCLDPLVSDEKQYTSISAKDGFIIIPPGGFVLGKTMETFNIPRNCLVLCVGKSTYARLGVFINVTPLEPEFVGNIVIEIFNSNTRSVKLYIGQGIAQFIFLNTDKPCAVSYKDRKGKYQGQSDVQIAKA